MEVVSSGGNGDARELFDRREMVGLSRKNTILLRSKTQGERPEGIFDVGVVVACVDEHSPSSIGEDLDLALRDAILMVGINPTKRNSLI